MKRYKYEWHGDRRKYVPKSGGLKSRLQSSFSRKKGKFESFRVEEQDLRANSQEENQDPPRMKRCKYEWHEDRRKYVPKSGGLKSRLQGSFSRKKGKFESLRVEEQDLRTNSQEENQDPPSLKRCKYGWYEDRRKYMPKNGGREQKNYRDPKKTCNIKIFWINILNYGLKDFFFTCKSTVAKSPNLNFHIQNG